MQPAEDRVDRVHCVVRAAAGVGVRLAVITGTPDGEGDREVFHVAAERGQGVVVGLAAGHRDRPGAVLGPSEDRKYSVMTGNDR